MSRKNTLGHLVRNLRQLKGWTLRKMSESVGIPLSTLAKVEQDKLSLHVRQAAAVHVAAWGSPWLSFSPTKPRLTRSFPW